ncbi:tRNA (adenosine(37)-N6)-dimethylallyltransferase MiaA [Yoonia sediminilitoris]|uniref:tRNA dimethylallyltransferase n=1 Tax=Yoonia sediminilitoris TaxID=1286148 RepID=A0A2T6KS59_9RHOB|nr:tRNA (adenosine(37)-N6)-dimethylallyltransferase MiaA [Yoonia sediminilitoris]PUB19355.1 tRNA dimethylallyltransferase [Yoonia sediminilitoris]RCW99523.1 tRNA dimethylallyltransferase [Yoonia sediminilitoris]
MPNMHDKRPITITPDIPVLIAGPTASGKSALALHIAQTQGGRIVNADALQVFNGWRLLTARPGPDDLAVAEHALYGHVPFDQPYSAGHWLRDVAPLLEQSIRPIIVGGTGLNFNALTKGLAEIPATPDALRAQANKLDLKRLLSDLDAQTRSRIDTQNRARVQRAWEVLSNTGRSLAEWQDTTPPPLLPLENATAITLEAPKDWLDVRITRRFDQMLDQGALDEAAAMLPDWNPDYLSSKAIGATELIAHLKGQMSLDEARTAAIIASRQYAKRQRTWFRSRHKDWRQLQIATADISATFRFRDGPSN